MADGVEVGGGEGEGKESKLMEWFKSGPKLMDVSSLGRTDGLDFSRFRGGSRRRRISENMKRRTDGQTGREEEGGRAS